MFNTVILLFAATNQEREVIIMFDMYLIKPLSFLPSVSILTMILKIVSYIDSLRGVVLKLEISVL